MLRLFLAAAVVGPTSALKYLSYYGDNVTAQRSWLSLAITEDGTTTDAFYRDRIQSLLRMPETGVFTRGTRAENGSQLTGGGLLAGRAQPLSAALPLCPCPAVPPCTDARAPPFPHVLLWK